MIDELIEIARTKPIEEARRLIAEKLHRPALGWITKPSGERVPLYMGQVDAR